MKMCDFPSEHWTRIRTNNVIERLNREIRRRTRVVGCFPDGNSALMLVCARLRHVAGTQWAGEVLRPQARQFCDSISPFDAVIIQQKRDDAHILDPVVVHVQPGAAGGDDDFFEEIPAL